MHRDQFVRSLEKALLPEDGHHPRFDRWDRSDSNAFRPSKTVTNRVDGVLKFRGPTQLTPSNEKRWQLNHLMALLPTGLVVDLDAHKTEYAEKYLKTHETYILVEKQTPEEDLLIPEFGSLTGDLARTPSPAPSVRSARSQTSDKVKYVALLENVQELLPEYRLRRANEKKKETGSRPMSRTSEEDSPGNTASARAKSRGHKSIKTVAHAVSAKRRMRGSGQTWDVACGNVSNKFLIIE